MLLGDRGSRWRCLLVWVSGTSSLALVALLLRPEACRAWAARGSLDAMPLDRALTLLAACALLGSVAWTWLALTATVVEAWRGVAAVRRRPWHPPDVVRRVVLAACGVALASGVLAPAGASDGAAEHRHLHGAALLNGLPLPDRAVAPRPADPTPAPSVIVRPGDSLWAIAERDLPPGAPERAVVSRWHAIYAANRAVIGPDPDLLEPGQRLLL